MEILQAPSLDTEETHLYGQLSQTTSILDNTKVHVWLQNSRKLGIWQTIEQKEWKH